MEPWVYLEHDSGFGGFSNYNEATTVWIPWPINMGIRPTESLVSETCKFSYRNMHINWKNPVKHARIRTTTLHERRNLIRATIAFFCLFKHCTCFPYSIVAANPLTLTRLRQPQLHLAGENKNAASEYFIKLHFPPFACRSRAAE